MIPLNFSEIEPLLQNLPDEVFNKLPISSKNYDDAINSYDLLYADGVSCGVTPIGTLLADVLKVLEDSSVKLTETINEKKDNVKRKTVKKRSVKRKDS